MLQAIRQILSKVSIHTSHKQLLAYLFFYNLTQNQQVIAASVLRDFLL